jgi:ATP-dependent DNA helicase RecG
LKENTYIEFKSSFNDGVIETLSAFANTKGGKVLVGLDDKGMPVKNFSVGDETIQKWINEIKIKTQPSIIADAELKKIKGKTVVELSIQEFPVKPIAFKSRFYKRVNNSNQILNATEISNLYMQSLQVSWDSYAYRNASFTDLSTVKIKAFIKKVNDGGRFILPTKPQEALLKLKLINQNEVSQAAMILFSKENLRYNVHVGRFKTPSLIIDDKLISGNLFDVLNESMQFIMSHLKVAFQINGNTTQRTEIFEYPIPAIRELLVNSLIHRDYSSSSDVQIKIYDQKISFFNPGNLFGNIELKDLKGDSYASQTRNKLIAEAFYLTKDIEKYGSGFSRIRNEISDYPTMKFEYTEQGNGFYTELAYTEQKKTSTGLVSKKEPKKIKRNVTDNVTDNVTENRLLTIIDLIKKDMAISTESIATSLKITRRTVARDIEKLKEKGVLIRIGHDKGGHWKIIKEINAKN